MDLGSFKLLKEDSDSYHIGHPNGKKLIVDKKGLSEKAHAAIRRYANGTPNEPVQPVQPDLGGMNAIQNGAVTINQPETGELALNNNAPDPRALAPEPEQAMANVQQQVGQQDPFAQKAISTEQNLGQQEKQLADYGAQEQAINNKKIKALDEYNTAQKGVETPDETFNRLKSSDDALKQAYMSKQLDPDRYLKNQSTGSRIAASIGLLFSGFGSGASGQSNLAMDHINRAIDQDIEAQKNEQGKAMNLYKMNHEAFQDEMKAHAATQNQMWTGVQAKLEQYGAEAQNPALKLKMQEATNQIEQQKIENRQKMALISGGGGGMQGPNNVDPALLVPMYIKDPAQQKVAFDEIERAQNINKIGKDMISAFDEAGSGHALKGGQTVVSKITHLGADAPAILRLKGLAATQFKNLDGTAREFAQRNFEENFVPAPGDSQAKIDSKREGLQQWMQAQASAPTAKGASGSAIDLSRFASTASPQGEQYKISGGVKYKRGPNGEAIRVN